MSNEVSSCISLVASVLCFLTSMVSYKMQEVKQCLLFGLLAIVNMAIFILYIMGFVN
jgi:hypothetical protein